MDTALLYGNSFSQSDADRRFDKLKEEHVRIFGCEADSLFSAPGRTELGGNHTDHNLGCVIAGSVSLDTIAAVHETNDYVVTIVSEGYPRVSVDISNLNVVEAEKNTTDALVRGVAASIASRGGFLGGFSANTSSNIFKGSGLSSSASVEVLIGTIFNVLFNENRFSTTELAIFGQEAECRYFGKPCGLMDQVACANGGIVAIDFKDQSNPVIESIAVDFESYGYSLAVTNTGGSHENLTPDYAAIPSEMKACASFFGKNAMREVPFDDFKQNIRDLRCKINNDRAILRAYHFLSENQRAIDMALCLKNNDFKSYIALVRESGLSSYMFLQNVYSSLNAKSQGISLGIACSQMFSGEVVCRVHGGGFAGTVQSYVPVDYVNDYKKYMDGIFGDNSCTVLSIRKSPACKI